MLKKSIIIVVLALILPSANLLAEEKDPKAREGLKKQPGTRIQRLEERLGRIEKILQRRGGAREERFGAQQKALKSKKEQPKEQPQRKRAQQGQQKMQKWFVELEKAYKNKNMEKIGQLIEKSKKFRRQMKKRRAEVGQERPGLREGIGGGFGRGRRFDDKPLRGRSGRGDRMLLGRRRDFQGRRSYPCPYRSDYGRGRGDRQQRKYSDWDW